FNVAIVEPQCPVAFGCEDIRVTVVGSMGKAAQLGAVRADRSSFALEPSAGVGPGELRRDADASQLLEAAFQLAIQLSVHGVFVCPPGSASLSKHDQASRAMGELVVRMKESHRYHDAVGLQCVQGSL